jgi:hypothetical protein
MAAGLLVAKPKFDREGTDLLVFLQIADGVKFGRIQCKGRSLANSDSNITIPAAYVTNGFIVFLYVEDGSEPSELFCFLATDVYTWSLTGGKYRLPLAKANFRAVLSHCRFDSSKIELIRTLIGGAEVTGEFRHLVYGRLNATLGGVSAGFRGEVLPP